MTDQTLAARMAASLAAALSSRSGTTEAANETTNEADKDQKMRKAGAEIARGGTGKSYGVVLKGGNDFAAGAGVTGAAAARIDNPAVGPTLRRAMHASPSKAHLKAAPGERDGVRQYR
jgi:uncharacterized membrane protein